MLMVMQEIQPEDSFKRRGITFRHHWVFSGRIVSTRESALRRELLTVVDQALETMLRERCLLKSLPNCSPFEFFPSFQLIFVVIVVGTVFNFVVVENFAIQSAYVLNILFVQRCGYFLLCLPHKNENVSTLRISKSFKKLTRSFEETTRIILSIN